MKMKRDKGHIQASGCRRIVADGCGMRAHRMVIPSIFDRALASLDVGTSNRPPVASLASGRLSGCRYPVSLSPLASHSRIEHDHDMSSSSPEHALAFLNHQTVQRARAQWSRDAKLPVAVRARKARSAVSGLARAAVLLRRLDEVGGGCRVNGRAVIVNDGEMRLGDACVLRGIPTAVELVTGPAGVLRIGRRAIINSGTSICAYGSITIGDRALIGPGVMINDTSFHDLHERHVMPAPLPIVIEDDVWIGAKASILPGVRIGRGAVVSAHALVQRDVEPFTIVGGVPASLLAKINPRKFVVDEMA